MARRSSLTVARLLWAGLAGAGIWLACGGPARAVQVYVQDSPAAAELIHTAEDRLSKDEAAEAARLIQEVFDQHGSKLLELESGLYAEAREVARQRLLQSPAWLSVYRRLHEPLASRLLEESGSDERLLDDLVDRYGLTDAGLAAALRLAGLALEAGRAEQAGVLLQRLDGHPALDRHRVLWERLSAAAGLLAEDPEHYRLWRQRLADASRPDAVAWLDALAESLRLPAAPTALNPLDALPSASVPRPLGEPLWSHPIEGIEQYLVETFRADGENVDDRAEDGSYLNALPVIAGSTLYVNDGLTVHALEPSSGMLLWRRRIVEPTPNIRSFGRYRQWLPSGVDLNLVAVSGRRVVAVGGFGAMVTIHPYYNSVSDSRLVCLDNTDGAVLWDKAPEDVDEDLEDGFWYGRPLIAHGTVYATLRRRQRTHFQDAYVIALDLHSGELLWRRHLASTAITDRRAAPGLTHLLLRGGRLYVDSRLGTIARLSAADGAVDWLTLLPVGGRGFSGRQTPPWHGAAPILVDAGLIVLDEWEGVVRVLDPASGQSVRTLDRRQWDSPDYLLPVGDDVLAVGRHVQRYDGATLERQWAFEPEGEVLGRAVIAGDRLYLPLADGLRIVDLSTGAAVEAPLALSAPANVLPRDGQLIVAHRDRLSSYSSWEIASGQLNRRIADRPDAPQPLVALSWLAYRTGRPEVLLRTLDRTIDLLRTGPGDGPLAERLFEQVLAMARDSRQLSEDLRRKLFDRLALLAGSAEQEVTYRLALADFLEQVRRPGDAVEQYQAVLEEPAFRRRLYHHDNGSRQAAIEAQRRLAALLERHGRLLYEPYEAFARLRFEELSEQGDAQPLVELSESYPLAEVAPEALRLAAERAADAGHPRRAIQWLRRAVQLTDDADRLAVLFGRQVELFESGGQPHLARRLLRSVEASHPSLRLVRDGSPIEPRQWLRELGRSPEARAAAARIDLPLSDSPRSLGRGLMLPGQQTPHAGPPPGIVLRDRRYIELHRASDLGLIWRQELGRTELELLAIDGQRVWLYSPRDHRIELLDASTGERRWHVDQLDRRLAVVSESEEPDAAEDRDQEQRLLREQVMVFRRRLAAAEAEGAPLLAVSDTALAAADRRGRVIVLDAEDGRVLWQMASPVRRTLLLLLDDRYLVIAGQDEQSQWLLGVYDARSGQLIQRLSVLGRRELRWAALVDYGLLLYADETHLEAFDLNRGQPRWTSEPGVDLAVADTAQVGDDRLVVRSEQGDLLWIDLDDGRLVNRQVLRDAVQGRIRLEQDAETWFIGADNGLIALDKDGRRLWSDAITDSVSIERQLVTERHVVLLSGRVRDSNGPSGRRLYILDRETGAIRAEAHLEIPTHLSRLLAIDGKLLLGGHNETVVLTDSP